MLKVRENTSPIVTKIWVRVTDEGFRRRPKRLKQIFVTISVFTNFEHSVQLQTIPMSSIKMINKSLSSMHKDVYYINTIDVSHSTTSLRVVMVASYVAHGGIKA